MIMAYDQTAFPLDSPRAAGFGLTKALPSPVTDAEKQEKLSRSMRLAFDNIPWKGPRPRNTPLGVTGAMRTRSPRVTAEPEPVVTPMQLSHPCQPTLHETDSVTIDSRRDQQELISPVTVVAISPAPITAIAPALVSKDFKGYSRSTPSSPTTSSVKKKRDPPTSIMSIKSAGLLRSKDLKTSPRPATSAEPQTNKSTISSSQTVPIPRSESSKSPAIVTSTVEMKSPSRSIMSIQSAKSFMSLRSSRSMRSPGTPDSNASPRERSFKSKISSGLGAIKEHAVPRRSRSDNSAPRSAKDYPLPTTPAYDKKRFEIRPPVAPVPPTPKFWTDQHNQTAYATTKADATAAYNANHVLPFRQYAESPSVATVTTTITAGGS